MSEAGVTDPGDIDCLVAMTGAPIEAQLSTDRAATTGSGTSTA